jgi:hypothetical protein
MATQSWTSAGEARPFKSPQKAPFLVGMKTRGYSVKFTGEILA